jgi:hypothetical protein
MAAVSSMNSDLEKLIAECLGTLPVALSAVTGAPSTPESEALGMLMDRARKGSISTLPYALPANGTVRWVSFGGDSRGLLEYAEDLRSWVLPGYGTHGDLEFARAVSPGRLANLVHSVSPVGYLRWTSDANRLPTILGVLNQMHALLTSMPVMAPTSPPSVHVLRFRFVSALRCGEWEEAEQVINDIDRWNLEQAHKTMQMRLRLLGESRGHTALLEMVEKHNLWALTHPTRVAEVIVEAVICEILYPLESTHTPDVICEILRPWFAKLSTVLPLVAPQVTRAPLFAYFACLDGDRVTALALLADLPRPLADFVRERFQAVLVPDRCEETVPGQESKPTAVAEAKDDGALGETSSNHPSSGQAYWNTLQALVRQGSLVEVELYLSEIDARVSEDARLLDAVPDVLMDLISDPITDASTASRNALQELLTALVDVIFSIPDFPNPKHLDLYLSVAEALVYVRGDSASEEDAHLLHGLLAAIANLSSASVQICTKLLRTWWQLRPILSRLDWLLAVLDSLVPLHPHPDEIVDLWAEAVSLAQRKQMVLSPSQLRLWRRVSSLLELDASAVSQDLVSLQPLVVEQQTDVLANTPWQKIAIVSLQETAAREAARELQLRTKAEVIVVTSLVQDGLTKTAKTADVILLVWAACSHAVYRAFDDCRSRVAYVQGTGTSSIVASAERCAEKISAEKLL